MPHPVFCWLNPIWEVVLVEANPPTSPENLENLRLLWDMEWYKPLPNPLAVCSGSTEKVTMGMAMDSTLLWMYSRPKRVVKSVA